MKAFAHPDEALHAPQFFLTRGRLRGNFEIPARAASLRQGLASLGLAPEAPAMGTAVDAARLHDPDYIAFLAEAAEKWAELLDPGPEVVPNIHPSPEMLAQSSTKPAHIISRAGAYTADTACPIGAGTYQAAMSAVGCALAAAEVAVAGGTAYALCRPPGHHAYAARAGGHCYINNSALAAQRLRDAGAARVAVLDIDSHHGNGTQGIFWDRTDVLTISMHGDPGQYYPWYVGFADEVGAGENLNLPLAFGTGDEGWLEALGVGLARLRAFKPDALVVALGFDASEHEPLASLKVTEEGFARAGAAISALGLPTAICQEGGYAVDHLGHLLARFLGAWK
ncbi:histone deacetylase family protein [Rhodovarius crocodyli]|uniref:Histone deacetylase family protein n=1 Tax=Rhodovarius crocodyli TaxID=1979269 RepID=A0A437MEN0_9PROT|nr:histone deacetylase family protein [Rhodovarius crocodyli]RVT96076.1 histone deacetylase family protein [Rhodovarius crocodyli]